MSWTVCTWSLIDWIGIYPVQTCLLSVCGLSHLGEPVFWTPSFLINPSEASQVLALIVLSPALCKTGYFFDSDRSYPHEHWVDIAKSTIIWIWSKMKPPVFNIYLIIWSNNFGLCYKIIFMMHCFVWPVNNHPWKGWLVWDPKRVNS